MFVIACDSQFNEGQILVMVNRKYRKDSFWTATDLSDVFKWVHRRAAEAHIKRHLKMNNPRVISYEVAKEVLREQEDRAFHEQAMADSEAGWDGHKGAI